MKTHKPLGFLLLVLVFIRILWALLAMIIGHVFMAFQHRRQLGHVDVLPRMK